MLVRRLGPALAAACALASCSSSQTALCERSEDCPTGQFCRFTEPASSCANPSCTYTVLGETSQCHCGACTVPAATVQPCGQAQEGDPCDEAEWKGFVCRSDSCTQYCLPQCSCRDGRWRCWSRVCNDFCGPMGDAGYGCRPCGTPPKCVASCGAF